MDECKESKFPFLAGIRLGNFGASPLVDRSLYRQLVGSLLYLTHSRPDLEYDVGFVYRYMKHTYDIQWKVANIIMHYVQGTKHFGVHYAAGSPLEIVGFTDSDWARDSINRKSNSCYVFMLEHVSWSHMWVK